jgi:hypothetical protein
LQTELGTRPSDSGFFVVKDEFEDQSKLKSYVDANFKNLNGRCISVGNTLLTAKPFKLPITEDDRSKQYLFE